MFCNTVNVSEGEEKISAGLITSSAGSLYLDRHKTFSCKLGCLQCLSSQLLSQLDMCANKCTEYFTGVSTRALCNSHVSALNIVFFFFFIFFLFSLTKGNVSCDFGHSETNDNGFVGLFCISVFLNLGLKPFNTTSDSLKLFIKERFLSFYLTAFFFFLCSQHFNYSLIITPFPVPQNEICGIQK